jgi:hypothetical protein
MGPECETSAINDSGLFLSTTVDGRIAFHA